ncbi:MAG: transposase [Hyphomicrobiaceae bacterium]|nr:transposase [Hyphomicrobiaceae bacterium]
MDSQNHIERIEVLEGPTGRRNWPDEVKARIVLESFQPGVLVRDVAKRNGVAPQHLSTWRKLARDGKLVLDGDLSGFSELVVEDDRSAATRTGSLIEIEVGGVTVRLPNDAPAERIAQIVTALGKQK